MKTFKLTRYSTYEQTYADDFIVEAESRSEAVHRILDGEVEPINSELLESVFFDPVDESIEDEEGDILYEHHNENV